MNRAGEKGSLGNDHPSAPGRAARLDGAADRPGAVRFPVADRAEIRDGKIALRKNGRRDLTQNFRNCVPSRFCPDECT